MADNNKSDKPGGKTGELLLGLLGTLGGIAGPLITGQNIDFGMPFKLGAAFLNESRMKNDLIKALRSNPHTAEIADETLQYIPQITQGGGLMGILNQSVQVPQALPPSVGQGIPQLQTPILAETPSQPVPPVGDIGETDFASNILNTLIPSAQAAKPQETELQRMARFRPDIAEKVAQSQMSQIPESPINQIMKVMGLQKLLSAETPPQKREAEYQEYLRKSEEIERRGIATKEEAARIAKQKGLETPSVAYLAGIDAHNKGVGLLNSMLDTVNSGGMPSFIARLASGDEMASGFAQWSGLASSRDIQMSRDINQLVMAVVKQQSGVQYGFRELQWVKATQPSKWDTEETFRNGISMALNNALFNKYNMIVSRAQRAGNIDLAIREGLTLEQVKAYNILTKQLGERATRGVSDARVFADPNNQKLLDALGMQLLDRPTKY